MSDQPYDDVADFYAKAAKDLRRAVSWMSEGEARGVAAAMFPRFPPLKYKVGDIIWYGSGDSMRKVKVTEKSEDIRDYGLDDPEHQPGFIGIMVENQRGGYPTEIKAKVGVKVWGYDYQIQKVIPK